MKNVKRSFALVAALLFVGTTITIAAPKYSSAVVPSGPLLPGGVVTSPSGTGPIQGTCTVSASGMMVCDERGIGENEP